MADDDYTKAVASVIASAQMIGADSEAFHRFRVGRVDETVETENGPIPTLAGYLDDIDDSVADRIKARLDEYVGEFNAAQDASAAAQAAANMAQDAADTIVGAGRYRATVSAGVSGSTAVPSGETFVVPSSDGQTLVLWTNNNGTGVNTGVAFATSQALFSKFGQLTAQASSIYPLAAFKTGEILVAYDNQGRVITNLHPSSMYGFKYDDLFGVAYARVFADGTVQSWVDRYGNQFPSPTAVADNEDSSDTVTLETFDTDRFPTGAHNQWVAPRLAQLGARVYFGPATAGDATGAGFIYALQRDTRGPIQGRPLYRTSDAPQDDHNSAAMVVDPRPSAAYPVIVTQADHNNLPMRILRSTSADLGDLGDRHDIYNDSYAYSQTWRNPKAPDEIWNFGRTGGSGNATWYLHRSLDNGSTWTRSTLFVDDVLYFLSMPDQAGNGLHLGCSTRPYDAPDTIRYLYLGFDGHLALADGTVLAANVFASDYTPLAPFNKSQSTLIRQPADVNPRSRLFDLWEGADNKLRFVWAEFPGDHGGKQWDPNDTGEYRVAYVDVANGGAITQLGAVCPSGKTMESSDDGTSNYLAGAVVTDAGSVVVCRWNAPDNVRLVGDMREFAYDGSNWNLQRNLVAPQARRVGRPIIAIVSSWDGSVIKYRKGTTMEYCEMTRYETFERWSSSIRLLEL